MTFLYFYGSLDVHISESFEDKSGKKLLNKNYT